MERSKSYEYVKKFRNFLKKYLIIQRIFKYFNSYLLEMDLVWSNFFTE